MPPATLRISETSHCLSSWSPWEKGDSKLRHKVDECFPMALCVSHCGPGLGPVLFIHFEITLNFLILFSLPQKDAEIMRMTFPLESLSTGPALQDTRYRHRPLRTLIQNQTQNAASLKRLYEIHSAHRKAWKPANSFATLKWRILELHQHDHKTWNVFLPMDQFRDILPFRNNDRDHSFI